MAKANSGRSDLAQNISKSRPGDQPIRATLKTSDRVIRRVTDGIYREPWASIRELISNAYDADATRVVVTTDAPRFRQITVRDNGNGFTDDALASMCENIGGSQKRTVHGASLGVTSAEDPDVSPSGRRLIGKLGIGLFAVSQLTQQFRIVTKVKGARERTIADLVLFRYAERRGKKSPSTEEIETTGEVQITKVAADDIDSHGTDVIIDTLLPRTRDEFQSRDVWELVRNPPPESEGSVIRPLYHIGYTARGKSDTFAESPVLPWSDDDTPIQRFAKLTDAMFSRSTGHGGERRPSLKTTFDNYLRFVWLTALSVPIDYIGKHPFDLTGADQLRVFKLGKMKTGRAEEVKLRGSETLRAKLSLTSPERGGNPEFVVIMDGMELRRPLRQAPSGTAAGESLLFVGSDTPDMSKFNDRVTGGPLRFEGYLFWTPRVVPVEHNGVLIRVGDASGSLFDETFMRYQVSEQKRKEQVIAEIFVHEGMDAALNIDRENFNHSHPHYQYIAAWVHDAFKQLATRHKSLGAEIRKARLVTSHAAVKRNIEKVAEKLVESWTDGEEEPVQVEFVPADSLFSRRDKANSLLIREDTLEILAPGGTHVTSKKAVVFDENKARLTAVAQVLHASGVLDRLSAEKRQRLIADLAKLIFFEGAE